MTSFARIEGLGYYLPERLVTNHELSTLMDTSDEWIRARTGIAERHFAAKGQGTSDLGLNAAKAAMEDAQVEPTDIDLIIFATSTPDYYAPGCGCLLQEKGGFEQIPALDIRAQCAGFVYGLSVAQQYIKAGGASKILLVASEVQSTALDLTTRGRDSAVIFGDGYLRNQLATYEVHVARYYIKRGAFVAATNRGRYVVENFPQTPAAADALAVMVAGYNELGLKDLAANSQTVLDQNFPDYPGLNTEEESTFKIPFFGSDDSPEKP